MSLFARTTPALRSGMAAGRQPLRQQARQYASEQQPKSGTRILGMPPWLLVTVGIVGAIEMSSYGFMYNLKSSYDAKQEAAQSTPKEGVLIKDQWIPFTLSKVEPYNHNSKVYHFDFPPDAKDKVSGIQVAGALLTKSTDEANVRDDKNKPVIRPYTPISPPDQAGSLTLLIKEYQNGKLSPHISSLEPGKGQLMFKGPIQKYKYEPNTFDRGLCIAGGSGVTPMWQLINHSLSIPDDKTKWTLIFSNVSEKDILLRKEWEEVAKKYPGRLDVQLVIDKPSKGWSGPTGFVTAPLISKLFPHHDGQNKVMAFVCGPPPQINTVCGPKDGPRQGEIQGALKELGYAQEEVFKF